LGASAAAVSVAAATLPSVAFDASAPAIRTWKGQLAPDTQPALPQPKVLKSTDGQLALTLTAMPGTVDMGAPVPVRTLTYDGVVPGYTWELDAGDRLTVDLVNRLPPQTYMGPMRMDRPHEWATTNLHTHGRRRVVFTKTHTGVILSESCRKLGSCSLSVIRFTRPEALSAGAMRRKPAHTCCASAT
jgi:FtsP/CotA-like multicopper oxidase with cupredoxin domain